MNAQPTRRWHALALLLMALWAGPAPAADLLQLKAAFIYRFAQLTQWPPPPAREFTYCVAGDAELQEALRALTQNLAGGVHIVALSEPQRASQCQLLVLGNGVRGDVRRWLDVLGDEPVLIVGENPESFRNGAVIGLVIEPNGLAFRINQTESKRRGLAISYQMLKLAREVK